MDFLHTFFAGAFAKLKQSNPVLAGVTALVTGTVMYFADHGTALGIISLPTWAATATKWLAVVVLAINGHGEKK